VVFESVIKPLQAIKKPWEMFFFGLFVSSIAIFFDKADLVMIFLTVFACVPVMFHALRHEEHIDLSEPDEPHILKRHASVIKFYLFLYLGITVGFVAWYVFLPSSMSNVIFHQQIATIAQINSPAASNIAGNSYSTSVFSRIFMNNIKVMIFCILFSFFYGAGAIFILVWNSSVVAAAIGNIIKLGIAKFAGVGGFASAWDASKTVIYSFSKYFLHGVPEMLSYMVAGLAGGIISVAVINHDLNDNKFNKIMIDASLLVVIAIAIVLVAAFMEVYISHVIF